MRNRALILGVAAALVSGASWGIAQAYDFGNQAAGSPGSAGPLDQVRLAAARHGDRPECNLTPNKLAAVMLPPTWAETTGKNTNLTPHPMVLGRADAYRTNGGALLRGGGNKRLYFEGDLNAHGRVFWHPGVGMWQVDDAGLGRQLASGKFRPYNTMATYLAQRWCDTEGNLNAMYQPWFACRGGWCRTAFEEIYDPATDSLRQISGNGLVNYWGGIEARTCRIGSQRFDCYRVDPGAADPDAARSTWIYNPMEGGANGASPSPLALPYYAYKVRDGQSWLEYRVWLDEDLPDKNFDVVASRRFGQDARARDGASGGLTWQRGSNLCDVTGSRGHC